MTKVIIAQGQITVVDLNDPISSSTEPIKKVLNMLWLDTSVSPAVLKCWNGTAWEKPNDNSDDIDDVIETITTLTTDLNLEKGKISMLVSEVTETTTTANNALDAINGLQIGARNIARYDGIQAIGATSVNKREFLNSGTFNILKWDEWGGGAILDKYSIYEPDTSYVMRFEIYINNGNLHYLYFTNGQGMLNISIYIDGVKQSQGYDVAVPINLTDGRYHEVIVYFATPKVLLDYNVDGQQTMLQPDKFSSVNGFFIDLARFKIEKGTKPTDWTPPPEDVNNRITTEAEIAADERETLAKDTNQKIADSKQETTTEYNAALNLTKQDINLKVEEVKTITDTQSRLMSSLQNEVELTKDATSFVKTKIEEVANVLDGKVDTVTIKEWARFNGSSLELGASNSIFKAILTNTELGFYQSDTKVAWISNNELQILSANIKQKLTIGKAIIEWSDVYGLTIRM